MARRALDFPAFDPEPLFEHYRAGFASNLLIAAVAHFRVFELLSRGPLSFRALRDEIGLEDRPAVVLLTALRAMGLIVRVSDGCFALTPLASEQLAPGGYFNVTDYLALASSSPAVLEITERLRVNTPANSVDRNAGAAFIYREGMESAMEKEASARQLTLALAGRAKNVAPALAARVPLGDGVLLDVGGGTGIYAIALLQANPGLRAIVLDRPEVLKIAHEFAVDYGVSDRMEFLAGDMFTAPLPSVDFVLLSNVLHDWDVPQCRELVARYAACLKPDGKLLIHDVLLNDELDGPLAMACYSAQLFMITEGRAYSAAEYRAWLREAGLEAGETVPTSASCHVISASIQYTGF